MTNLWQGSKKSLYKELYMQYLEEGYSKKESKRFASDETEEFMSFDEDFVKDIFSYQEEEEC